MNLKTGKHNTMSLIGETESDFLLLSMLGNMDVHRSSNTYQDNHTTEICLQFVKVSRGEE